MNETDLADRILNIMTAWGTRTEEIQALWLTGSFATGAADRFSDIDLRGCVESESFDWFSSVEDALPSLDDWFVMKRRQFSKERPDSEIVVDFRGGLCLDFHVVTPDRLKAAYLDPYPIRVLIDKGCNLKELHASSRQIPGCQEPTDVETRISRGVMAWSFLGYAIAKAMRGKDAAALSFLEGARAALAQLLLGRTEAISAGFAPEFLPKYLTIEAQEVLDATVPKAASAGIPNTIVSLAAALENASTDLENADATRRLARIRGSVKHLIQREFPS